MAQLVEYGSNRESNLGYGESQLHGLGVARLDN